MPLARLVRAAAAVMLASAGLWSCYSPNFVSGVTKCSTSGACPNDWVCESGVCVDQSATGTGGTSATGGHGGGTATGGHGGSGAGGSTATGGHGGGGTGGTVGGNGGAVGSGGVTGTGGTPATGGSPGTGGAAGNPPTCIQGATMPPATALISDFSDGMPDTSRPAGDYTFGSVSGFPLGTARYASGSPGAVSIVSGQLVFSAAVEAPTTSDMYPFSGMVLFMSGLPCINASQYSGVSFNLALSGSCSTIFQFSDSEHTLQANDVYRGTCPTTSASCFSSQFSVTSGHNKIPFNATPLVNGQPTATVDRSKLIGVQWQFGTPSGSAAACTGSITIDNVSFY